MSDEDLLETLLEAAEEHVDKASTSRVLRETDLFKNSDSESVPNLNVNSPHRLPSVVHKGDTDSSEDEDNRHHEQRFNSSGREIRNLLAPSTSSGITQKNPSQTWKTKSTGSPATSTALMTDPVFGLKIINPLISSRMLQERMSDKESVPFSRLKAFTLNIKANSDRNWVVAGVIIAKSNAKTSQRGQHYLIWTLSDLKNDMKTAAVFLFSSAYKQLWKSSIGTVVGILNPQVMDRSDGSKDEACLSVDNPQKVIILGQSKDFGTCRSTKKNGDKCMSVVNLSQCEFCVYHIKQQYQKCSALRPDLQANFTGRGLTALRNKVLGKNEVFYAGQSYTAIPAKKSRKMQAKDDNRLDSLFSASPVRRAAVQPQSKGKTVATSLEISQNQRLKDRMLLEKLSAGSSTASGSTELALSSKVTLEESKSLVSEVLGKLKAKKMASFDVNAKQEEEQKTSKTLPNISSNIVPKLSDPSTSADFFLEDKKPTLARKPLKAQENEVTMKESRSLLSEDLKEVEENQKKPANILSNTLISSPQTATKTLPIVSTNFVPKLSDPSTSSDVFLPRKALKAKENALNYIRKSGPLAKHDPNATKTKKRSMEPSESDSPDAKKTKLEDNGVQSERFRQLMGATSAHLDLLARKDDEEQEKYFHKLAMKEQMEEKMATTYKMACKAVRCLQCKYTSFSASDRCKSEKHALKVFDATKRFFKCTNCRNRTVSLDVVPTKECTNCGRNCWTRTGMMEERIVKDTHRLSIRGGEQTFVNSVVTDANVNLLVADE